MRIASSVRELQITIRDLVAAITDAALEVSENESKAYQIAGLALNRVLRVSLNEAEQVSLSGTKWLH